MHLGCAANAIIVLSHKNHVQVSTHCLYASNILVSYSFIRLFLLLNRIFDLYDRICQNVTFLCSLRAISSYRSNSIFAIQALQNYILNDLGRTVALSIVACLFAP